MRHVSGIADRFWSKVDKTETCWNWTGGVSRNGYGAFHLGQRNGVRRQACAHRVGWVLQRGPIPGDLTIDHLCRNRLCVRADHMETVTRGENSRRAGGIEAAAAAKRAATECSNGHPYTAENTYIDPTHGGRSCRTCRRRNSLNYCRRKAAR